MITRVLLETIVTRDLDRAVAAWTQTLGWEVRHQSKVDAALAEFWHVEQSDFGRYAVLVSPGTEQGYLRLLEGPTDDDTGSFHHPGLFNAEFLCQDVDELHGRLQESTEFEPLCSPTTYDLASTGGACSRSFATRGPGGAGVFFTTYLSVPPPRELPVCEHLVGPMFNSAMAVEDGDAMTVFFETLLGMERRLEGRIASPAINRILDLPEEWGFHMVVYKGQGDGLIEVDVHEHELPRGFGSPEGKLKPGNSFLTVETSDIDEIARRGSELGRIRSMPTRLSQPPFGGRRVMLLRGPADEPVEVVEKDLE
jgi:catechol 2,3-dioxygenase-like lactoylglutathione lyase family enzyme